MTEEYHSVEDFDEENDKGWSDDPEYLCIKCADVGDDACDACGAPLCHMHNELGVGFCGKCDIETYMRDK